MKYFIFISILNIVAFAKVDDFNAIINEDIKAQKELHQQYKTKVYNEKDLANTSEVKPRANTKEVILVDNQETNYIAPSGKNFLKFKKEVKQKTPNDRKNQHRVAKEIKELGM